MTQGHLEEPKAISWKYVVWGISAVVVTLSIVIGVAIVFNAYREQRIVSEYTNETLSLVSVKKDLFRDLFTRVMHTCQIFDDQERERSKVQKDYTRSDMCQPAQEMLSAIGVESLKNSSAILYLAVQGRMVVSLEASGKYHLPSSIEDCCVFSSGDWGNTPKLNLKEYFLNGKPLPTMWWDYINYIPGKEVVVPIDIDGVRVGYIFRGVIER